MSTDFGKLAEQARKMQEELKRLQDEAEHELVTARRHCLARRIPLVKPCRSHAPLLAGDDPARSPEARGSLHTAHAYDAPVARSQRLGDRRSRAEHVDHYRDISRPHLGAGECDVDHAAAN